MKDGDFVNIDFVGRIKESGEIFDLTDEALAKESRIHNPKTKYGPVTIIIGAGQILKGLEEKIKELKIGETAEVNIVSKDAFGERDSRLIKIFNANHFKKQNIVPVPGHFIDFGGTKGRVVSAASGRVRMDFNHPLAGKTLTYKVTLNQTVTDKIEQIGSVIVYYTAMDDGVDVSVTDKKVKIMLPSGSDVSSEMKEKISAMITKYVTGADNVEFAEVYTKKAEQ
ncbi:MAG: FKBP-type peptidyl-prolyl cis-trans isomerase [archaeon]|nr:FKBP-type peptidyl-prolyl cis-trans isomerase [archaeon]